MIITDIRINHMVHPIGFDSNRILLSYTIDEAPTDSLTLSIRKEDAEGVILHTQTLDYRQSYGTEIDYKPELETRYCLQIQSGEFFSDNAFFETSTAFACEFITPEEALSHPVIFKSFQVKQPVAKARLYITGLGLYEAYINHQKVGNEYLTPNCNDYDAYLQVQTYDVTKSIQENNIIEIILGNGWYKGRFGLKHKQNIYGSDFVTAAKLVCWYPDGIKQVVIETDLTWSARSSIVIDSSIYDGEIQNAMNDVNSSCSVKKVDRKFQVEPRISLPIVVKQQITPDLILSPKGEQILDFKQNMTGFVSFDIEMKKGQTIRLQASEVLQQDCFYRDNLRSAKAEFQYTSDGNRKVVRPFFTFFGFRYMLVEGISKVDPKEFIGNVLFSDLEETIDIKTDNGKINRLLQNSLWSQRGNFVDVPTDCPQRDERLGWTGDAEVYSKTACYHMSCQPFYDKYLKDMAIDQALLNGMISSYSPAFREQEPSGSVWSDAATIIPWNVYLAYGDKAFLRRHYPMMERYVRMLITKDDNNGKDRLFHFGFHLGDWLSQDGATPNSIRGATSEFFIASAYYYNSIRIVCDASRELGFDEKERYFKSIQEQVKEAILKEYFSASGRLTIDTQTAYAICVNFDLYIDQKKLTQGFSERLRRDGYHIKGGFVGATQLIQALIKSGLTDDAFITLYSETFPSWLYCVNLGATTIWERWNSINADGSISSTGMNSLNHYAYGSVAEAFYAFIAGLRPLSPGYKKVVIEPKFNYRLRTLDFSYQSVCGRFSVKYRIVENHKVELILQIPFGVEAVLILENGTQTLAGGNYTITVTTSQDFDHPYSIDSKICELIANPKAQEVLKGHVRGIYDLLIKNDLGFGGESLRKLLGINSAYTNDVLSALNDSLAQVTYAI